MARRRLLDLLEDQLTHPDVQHVLLIGAYRDNELTSAQPLTRTLGAIRNAGVPVKEIVLTPLASEDVGQPHRLFCVTALIQTIKLRVARNG